MPAEMPSSIPIWDALTLAMGRKEESADAFYLSNRLFNDSAALIGRSITKGYVSILEAEKGNFSASRELIAEAGKAPAFELLRSPWGF